MALRIPEIKTTLVTIPMAASTTTNIWFLRCFKKTKQINDFTSRNKFIVNYRVSEIRENYPDDYIIAFVRNPYDWACAQKFRGQKPYKLTVKHFQNFFSAPPVGQSIVIDQEVDYLGHFETLQDDINKLTEILNFPKIALDHIHKNKFKKTDYLDFLDVGAKEFIYKIYKKDFEFGYERGI